MKNISQVFLASAITLTGFVAFAGSASANSLSFGSSGSVASTCTFTSDATGDQITSMNMPLEQVPTQPSQVGATVTNSDFDFSINCNSGGGVTAELSVPQFTNPAGGLSDRELTVMNLSQNNFAMSYNERFESGIWTPSVNNRTAQLNEGDVLRFYPRFKSSTANAPGGSYSISATLTVTPN